MSEIHSETLGADDPGLTAYALGELDGADAERYTELVRKSPELQALVQEIQAEAQLLSAELQHEPVLPLTTDRRAAILVQASSEMPVRPVVTTTSRRGQWLRWIAVATGTAAVATVVAISLPRPRTQFADAAKRPEAKASFDHHTAAPGSPSGMVAADVSGGTPESSSPVDAARKEEAKGDGFTKLTSGQTQVLEELSSQVAQTPSPGANVSASTESTPLSTQPTDKKGMLLLANESIKKRGFSRISEPVSDRNFSDKRTGEGNPSSDEKPSARPNSGAGGAAMISPESAPKGNAPQSKDFEHSEAKPSDKQGGQSNAGGPSSKSDPSSRKRDSRLEDGESKNGQSDAFSTVKGPEGLQKGNESNAQGDSSPTGKRLKDSLSTSLPKLHSGKPADGLAPGDAGATKGKQFGETMAANDREIRFSIAEGKRESELGREKQSEARESKREMALLELEKARSAERFRPGSVPLGDLKKLEESAERFERKPLAAQDPTGDEAYQPIFENAFIPAAQEQLSTFSIDVDSASYANTRRYLQSGQLPPADAVRIEELINYFSYQYPVPQDGKPFSVNTDIAACPWNPGHSLVRIGLKGKEIPKGQRPPSSLVFLVDVSGSMSAQNKLPLVRESLKTLVGQLDERDRIAIVTYAGEAGVRLPSTSVTQRETILSAIDGLGAGGSTNGAAGINTAYDIAAKEFVEKGTNRVILCTDGDFNVGVTSNDALVQMIQTRAKSGVFLSIFGFGMGNLKDARLESLADKGNGQYGYIDDRQEAEKVFVQELSGTLVTIAKDVKIQIDFNKNVVDCYRLIGYENRVLAAEDFHDDKKDAGEIGAGHTVTALYEIVPVKDLKADDQTRWMTVKLRYKQPEATVSELIENPLLGQPGQLKLASSDFQFAASVASFGMLLRNSRYAGQSNWSMVKELAQSGLSNDQYGHRSGFRRLVDQAESLIGERRPAAPAEPDSTVNGKYKSLLRRLNVPEDAQKHGQFKDYGFDKTKSYAGSDNLPEGYWVYVAPYWYIWGETTQADKPLNK